MNGKQKPVIEKAADTINDVVEEMALKAADAAIEPDPEHVAGASNEQLYLPEASEKVAAAKQPVTAMAAAEPQPAIKKAVKKEGE